MELEILGSGTSHGIPVIGCACPVCDSKDPRDARYRASALIRADDGTIIVIDSGPEFRLQAIRARLTRVDALLVTHPHADHVHGLDDLRIFTHTRELPVYANPATVEELAERFSYIFRSTQEGGGKPHIKLIPVVTDSPEWLEIAGIRILPIPLLHGSLPILGWRIGDTAYLTDCNRIPEESFSRLSGVKNLVIDALRVRPHSTHFSFPEALEVIRRIGPERAWFTHICHDFSHTTIQEWLDKNAPDKKIEPAYDGLRITIHQYDN